jgi:uncharacterized membrane protein YphA (DoxX/SURF4 family)
VLLAALFIFSASMKLRGSPEMDQQLPRLGLDATMMRPLAIVELTCAALYLLPVTAVTGAILLTGYIGGAICTHWRVGDAFIMHIVIGVLIWLALYLREPRLRALIPLWIRYD